MRLAGNEFCERLAFYGLSANLSIYLIEIMGLNVSDASIQTSLFTGTAYLTPLLGAWLADGYWGRFKTIMIFSIIYAMVRRALHVSALRAWRRRRPGVAEVLTSQASRSAD
jgi:dipeptide/tripeptide permease